MIVIANSEMILQNSSSSNQIKMTNSFLERKRLFIWSLWIVFKLQAGNRYSVCKYSSFLEKLSQVSTFQKYSVSSCRIDLINVVTDKSSQVLHPSLLWGQERCHFVTISCLSSVHLYIYQVNVVSHVVRR